MDDKIKLGKMIKKLRKNLGMGQKDVCALIPDLEESALSNYETGRRFPSLDMVKKLAKVLKVTPSYLLDLDDFTQESNVELVNTKQKGRIPIMTWQQAGAIDINAPLPEATESAETIVDIFSHTFGLRVRDDSMFPIFPLGCIIIIEPSKEHTSGDYVVACNGAGQEATFKQIISDGTDWYLKPLNDRYPIKILLPQARIIGVVISMQMDFKQTT